MLKRSSQLRAGGVSEHSRDALDTGTRRLEGQTSLDYFIGNAIHNVELRVSWEAGVDVDASAALFSEELQVVDVVWYKKLESSCKSVKHSGDMRTGEGSGDEEVISVDMAAIPLHVHHVVFTVSVFSDGMTLADVTGAKAWLVNVVRQHRDDVLCSFPLELMTGNAALVGMMTRRGTRWNFRALAIPLSGRDAETLIKDPEIQECLRASPSLAPPLRHVQIRILEAAELATMEIKGRFGEKYDSADPYFIISFRNRRERSKHVRRTLAPTWNSPPFDLGLLAETEPSALKIEVFHHDTLASHRPMGHVTIPGKQLYGVEIGATNDFWFALNPPQDEFPEKPATHGKIRLQIEVSEHTNAVS